MGGGSLSQEIERAIASGQVNASSDQPEVAEAAIAEASAALDEVVTPIRDQYYTEYSPPSPDPNNPDIPGTDVSTNDVDEFRKEYRTERIAAYSPKAPIFVTDVTNNLVTTLTLSKNNNILMEYTFYISPENIDITIPSRVGVYQSIGGGTYFDHMGEGVTTIVISGHTGFHRTNSGSKLGLGYFQYLLLKQIVALYNDECAQGNSSDVVLTLNVAFADAPTYGCWDVVIKEFTLKRAVQNGIMLFRYNLTFYCVTKNKLQIARPTPAVTRQIPEYPPTVNPADLIVVQPQLPVNHNVTPQTASAAALAPDATFVYTVPLLPPDNLGGIPIVQGQPTSITYLGYSSLLSSFSTTSSDAQILSELTNLFTNPNIWQVSPSAKFVSAWGTPIVEGGARIKGSVLTITKFDSTGPSWIEPGIEVYNGNNLAPSSLVGTISGKNSSNPPNSEGIGSWDLILNPLVPVNEADTQYWVRPPVIRGATHLRQLFINFNYAFVVPSGVDENSIGIITLNLWNQTTVEGFTFGDLINIERINVSILDNLPSASSSSQIVEEIPEVEELQSRHGTNSALYNTLNHKRFFQKTFVITNPAKWIKKDGSNRSVINLKFLVVFKYSPSLTLPDVSSFWYQNAFFPYITFWGNVETEYEFGWSTSAKTRTKGIVPLRAIDSTQPYPKETLFAANGVSAFEIKDTTQNMFVYRNPLKDTSFKLYYPNIWHGELDKWLANDIKRKKISLAGAAHLKIFTGNFKTLSLTEGITGSAGASSDPTSKPPANISISNNVIFTGDILESLRSKNLWGAFKQWTGALLGGSYTNIPSDSRSFYLSSTIIDSTETIESECETNVYTVWQANVANNVDPYDQIIHSQLLLMPKYSFPQGALPPGGLGTSVSGQWRRDAPRNWDDIIEVFYKIKVTKSPSPEATVADEILQQLKKLNPTLSTFPIERHPPGTKIYLPNTIGSKTFNLDKLDIVGYLNGRNGPDTFVLDKNP